MMKRLASYPSNKCPYTAVTDGSFPCYVIHSVTIPLPDGFICSGENCEVYLDMPFLTKREAQCYLAPSLCEQQDHLHQQMREGATIYIGISLTLIAICSILYYWVEATKSRQSEDFV